MALEPLAAEVLMQPEKDPLQKLATEEQELLSTGGQLLKDVRQWLRRAADLYTQSSKTKVWVPMLVSSLMTGYYLYNSHAKGASLSELSAPVETSTPVAVPDIGPLPKAPAFTPLTQSAATSETDANDNDPRLKKRAEQAHTDQQFGEEARILQQLADRSSTPQQVCPAIGRAYERAGEIDSAIQAFEQCVRVDPGNVDTLVAFGHVLQTENDFRRAASLYRQGLLKDPGNLDAQTGLALIELRQNHLVEASEAVRTILQKMPDSTDALLIAGIVAWRQTRFAEAKKTFLKGIEIDDRRADFHAFLGRIAEAERRPQDALRQYERALTLDPHDTEIADRCSHLRDPQ